MTETKRRQKIYPSLVKADEGLCKTHTWIKSKLVLTKLDTGFYTLCKECGFVSGTKFKLNGPGLEVLNNNIKLADQKYENMKKSVSRFEEIFKADRILWIKTNINKFGKDLEENQKLLEELSLYTRNSIEAAYDQVDREFKKD